MDGDIGHANNESPTWPNYIPANYYIRRANQHRQEVTEQCGIFKAENAK